MAQKTGENNVEQNDQALQTETADQTQATETQNTDIQNIVTISEAGPCRKKVSVEIPAEKIKSALDREYKELRYDAVIPGFRKGRAPMRLIEKRFGGDISDRVKLKLLADASDAAIKDNKIDSLSEPEIDHEKISLPAEGPMKFEFEVEVRPEFELPGLEGIKIEKPVIETTDKQIDQELTAIRSRAGLWVPKDKGPVQEGDQVIADVLLAIEGLPEHEKFDNIDIFARKNGFAGPVPVEQLDTLLAGCQRGDVKKTTVEVPATYFNEKYRGKKVALEITVKEIKQLQPAELNEEFFRRFDVENEQQLRQAIGKYLASSAEQEIRNTMSDQVYKYLLENTKLELPSNIVADQATRILQRQYSNLLIRKVPQQEIEKRLDTLRASSEDQARGQLKQLFVMEKAAEKLGISVSEEEINGYIAEAAAYHGRRPERMREELTRDGSLAQFALQIREQKCVEKILEKAQIAEVPAEKLQAKPEKKTTKEKASARTEKTADKPSEKSAEKTPAKTPAKKDKATEEKHTKEKDIKENGTKQKAKDTDKSPVEASRETTARKRAKKEDKKEK